MYLLRALSIVVACCAHMESLDDVSQIAALIS